MNTTLLKKNLLLLLTAIIWGVAFVAQSAGMEFIGPFTFTSLRNFLGALVLLPVIWIRRQKLAPAERAQRASSRRFLWLGGLVCGAALAAASCLQQIGIQYTTTGKAGFITALYIILVPLLGLLFKRRVSFLLWISIVLSVAGMYLLCLTGSSRLELADILLLLSALGFAVQILCIDFFAPRVDAIELSCLQFFFSGVICAFPMLFIERPSWTQIAAGWLPLLYAGLLSSGVGYTLQVVGQKNNNPTVASLIMSLEAVVSVIAGWLLLKQVLSLPELCGCGLMLVAVVLAQLSARPRSSKT